MFRHIECISEYVQIDVLIFEVMRTIKDTKGLHNRISHGSWNGYGTKEERKDRRRMFKAVRHKLLMCIPLSGEEERFRNTWKIESDTRMDCCGYPTYRQSGKWGCQQIWKLRKV